MNPWIWAAVASAEYLIVGLCTARSMYKRRYREFLLWKNREPNATHRLLMGHDVYDAPPRQTKRKVFTYQDYMRSVNMGLTPNASILGWLPILLFLGFYKFLHPTVATPDEVKVKELERDIEQYDRLNELDS